MADTNHTRHHSIRAGGFVKFTITRRMNALSENKMATGCRRPSQQATKRILYREEVCMGCKLCEVHCLVQHSKSKDILKAYKRETPKPFSRIRVDVDQPSTFTAQCRHCEDPLCVISCLSGAMHLDEKTGLVAHNPEKCIGCWTCIMICPYSAIRIDTAERKIVAKCDQCPDLEIPACVANCPNEALVYQEVTPHA